MHQSKIIGNAADNERKRKEFRACNCKRSNCLKLYCECFANSFHCNPGKCNCLNCLNNPDHESIRKVAVEYTLERNPMAFRSKVIANETVAKDTASRIQSHHKGCHCKKSNCLKKYCECFQANIVCTERCRCSECKNFLDSELREKALQKIQETNAELAESSEPKHLSGEALMMYYLSESKSMYKKFNEKLNDALLQVPSDLQLYSAKGLELSSGETLYQKVKKQRIAKEFSQCLDSILDHTDLLYNATSSNDSKFSSAHHGAVAYESAFTVTTKGLSQPPGSSMQPLQGISSSGAIMPPVPYPADDLIMPPSSVSPAISRPAQLAPISTLFASSGIGMQEPTPLPSPPLTLASTSDYSI